MQKKTNFQIALHTYLAPQLRTLPVRIESGFAQSVGSDGLPTLDNDWTNEDFA